MKCDLSNSISLEKLIIKDLKNVWNVHVSKISLKDINLSLKHQYDIILDTYAVSQQK